MKYEPLKGKKISLISQVNDKIVDKVEYFDYNDVKDAVEFAKKRIRERIATSPACYQIYEEVLDEAFVDVMMWRAEK